MPSSQPPINLDPNQDPAQQLSFINQNFQSLANALNPLIVSDGTTTRIILGKQNDGTYGLRVSQAGIDVGTATNSQLIFNSDQNIFKIAATGTFDIPAITSANPGAGNFTSDTAQLGNIVHGLGYTPFVVAAATYSSKSYPLPFSVKAGAGAAATWESYYAYTDNSKVYFADEYMVYGNTSLNYPAGGTIRYYLLQESAS